MELLHKVQAELEKKGYDFSSEFWTDEMLTVLYDAVYTTEKVIRGQEHAEKPELKKSPTTYRECLEALPDGYRELALKNAEEQDWWGENPNNFCKKIYTALSVCIHWEITPQGWKFWNDVFRHYERGTSLSELPNNE